MEIATCSYSEFRPEMGQPVRTSLGKPKFWTPEQIALAPSFWPLTPRPDYLRAPKDVYVERFHEQLERHGVEKIERELRVIGVRAGAERVVLLCFENLAKGSWCHRTLFAKWWMGETGEVVPELGNVPLGDTPGGEEWTLL